MTQTQSVISSTAPDIFSIKECQEKRWVKYETDGSITFKHTSLKSTFGNESVTFSPSQQYDAIFPSLTDLNKALSTFANSPLVEGQESVRSQFDSIFSTYQLLVQDAQLKKIDPPFGNYILDHVGHRLLMLLPEYWHRLGLVTNNGTLLSDPKNRLSWKEVRTKMDGLVIGLAGVSVGGNILEGICRELRPQHIKIADPDWIELTNLNRLMHGTAFSLTSPNSNKQSPRNSYEMNRVSKAEFIAYHHQQVDPYAQWYVYKNGLDVNTIESFLSGTGDEPQIDIMIEEVDDLEMKILIREECRKRRIPVMMFSDFGHRVLVQIYDFKRFPKLPLGNSQVSDKKLKSKMHAATTSGDRDAIFDFIAAICGEDYAQDEFALWVKGKGEQPTSSLPQSGATALVTGGIGAKIIWQYALGYDLPPVMTLDMKRFTFEQGL